jgi:hypothetical protein
MSSAQSDSSKANPFAALGMRADLKGHSYINWIRCSTEGQVDTSPQGQKDVNDAFAAIQEMRWAGFDVYADAVSGSQTFNREDVAEIIALKKARNDFDKVIVFELGRATRGGIRHAAEVETELRRAGLELLSSTELIPDGPIGELIKAVKAFSNQQQALNISKSVARGLAQSLAKATRPAAGRTPYGLDRLYLAPDETPRVLIRWDGLVQLRLDPVTGKEVGRAVRQPTRPPRIKGKARSAEGRKRFIGYKKQDDEISVLVPGSSQAAETVREIFRLYHIEDLGAHKIIKRLRSRNAPSPFGGGWSLTSVLNILENPIYIGKEVRHRWTSSLYHMLGPDGPIPVNVDQDRLQAEGRVSVPHIERSRDEWVLTDKPRLQDFLPPDVRDAATGHLMELFDVDAVRAKQARRTKKKNKSDDNPYVLAQLLRSQQTDHAMRGDTNSKQGKFGRLIRRYYFDYSTASSAISGLHARRVRAESLEDAIVSTVFELFKDQPWVEQQVRAAVAGLNVNVIDLGRERANLISEREEISHRLKRIHKTSGHLSDDELQSLVAEDNARIVVIRHDLGRLDRDDGQRTPTADEAVAAVSKRLAALPTDWRSLPNRELKVFLKAVVDHLSIDLATLDVDLSISLPFGATHAPVADAEGADGRLSFTSAWSPISDSTRPGPLKLDQARCERDRKTKCFTCHRLRRAA